MKVRPTNPDNAIGLIDPVTRRSPFFDHEGKRLESADVPENHFWIRRLLAGEIERLDGERSTPTGSEPLTPLTRR